MLATERFLPCFMINKIADGLLNQPVDECRAYSIKLPTIGCARALPKAAAGAGTAGRDFWHICCSAAGCGHEDSAGKLLVGEVGLEPTKA